MKKILFILTALLMLAACQNNQAPATANQDNKTATKDTISKETMQQNMQEVQAYLKECGAFFIATADGDQPRVRPFGVSEIINDRLYIMTGKVKDVYKQMAKNGKQAQRQRVDAIERHSGARRDAGGERGIPEPQRDSQVDVQGR